MISDAIVFENLTHKGLLFDYADTAVVLEKPDTIRLLVLSFLSQQSTFSRPKL